MCYLSKSRVLIADGYAAVREDARQILEQEPDLNIVAEAGDDEFGRQAVSLHSTAY